MILLLSDNYFTMVEEIFENGLSETLQIGIPLHFDIRDQWTRDECFFKTEEWFLRNVLSENKKRYSSQR